MAENNTRERLILAGMEEIRAHGMQGFSQTQFDAADLNEDGTVDVFDLALLKRAVLAK